MQISVYLVVIANELKMGINMEAGWKAVMEPQFSRDYMKNLREFLVAEQQNYTIYPPNSAIFRAFDQTPFEQVKVVILGQDPYHDVGQAHGLCFSVPEGIATPPSLRNIFKELQSDIPGFTPPAHGNLTKWAKQGVLLLNATLTVRAHQAGSHQNRGWEQFTDEAIRQLSQQRKGLIFLLWGRFAKNKAALIDSTRHHVLTAAHPSPLSAYQGFLGCGHFSKTNLLLQNQGLQPIDWQL